MSAGVKLIIGLLIFSTVTPIISLFITKGNRFVYHTYQPQVNEKYFVQVFYQSEPSFELNYVVCSRKPILIDFATTVDLVPRTIDYEYYLLPRGIFYRDKSVKPPKTAIFKHKNILVQAWRQKRNRNLKFFFIDKGKCIPIMIEQKEASEWNEKSSFAQTKLWKQLKNFMDSY